jgi:hypothetical protein
LLELPFLSSVHDTENDCWMHSVRRLHVSYHWDLPSLASYAARGAQNSCHPNLKVRLVILLNYKAYLSSHLC